MAEPILLIYNLDEGTDLQLRSLCEAQRICCRAVSPGEYALPIGVLAGIPVAAPAEETLWAGFSEPMLVMCHMLSPQLDAFLMGMRQIGIRIPLKAVLTPANVRWSSRRLRDELTTEHEAVTHGRIGS